MCRIQRNGSSLNVSLDSRVIGQIVSIVKKCPLLKRSKRTRTVAKTWEFVHIKPDTWELDFLIKVVKHIDPILSGIRMQEVNKTCGSWPDSTNKIWTGRGFDINISLEPFGIGKAITQLDSCINDWHIIIVLEYFVHSIKGEPSLVNSEILKVKHVVNIAPDGVQRKIIFSVFLQHCL